MSKHLAGYRAVDLLWEPRDLWIGVYWTREDVAGSMMADGGARMWRFLHIYVCLLPTLPLKVTLCLGRHNDRR
jgi:hypothetical protein